MAKKPETVRAYLDALPEDRRRALEAVRKVIRKNLPAGYAEGIQYGMIGYFVPHSRYPAGYHCDPSQPVPFASLASQKNHMAVYLSCVYGDEGRRERFESDWKATGKKLDMGKSCVRFKRLEDVALEAIGEAVRVPVDRFLEEYEAAIGGARGASGKKKAASKKAGTKKKAGKKAASKKVGKKKVVRKTKSTTRRKKAGGG